MENLKLIANKMVTYGKGILAADESTPTCTKRFQALGLESSEETRNIYRSLLLDTPQLSNYISGAILFDETFHQSITNTGQIIPDFLKSKDILTGIKVDTGAKNFANHTGEKITEGLDNLSERLIQYKKNGADFAKWRAVITISNKNTPSNACIYANAHALARYASICQSVGIVPIVEPEVLMDGDHNMETCKIITERTLNVLFEQLSMLNVDLQAMILKPNMILPGTSCAIQNSNQDIAESTLDVLINHVPEQVPGIAFLSGGQSSDLAADRLNLMNKLDRKKPWKLTFSYGRALQEDSLKRFSTGNNQSTQDALIYRAKQNHFASIGKL
jgi:fructose-bisphosphate aldolase class I